MKKWLACLVIVGLALALPALAAEKAAEKPAQTPAKVINWVSRGELAKWDPETKTFTLKIGAKKKEVPFVWNEKTKIEVTPTVGQKLAVNYHKEGLNTFVAEKIALQAPPPANK